MKLNEQDTIRGINKKGMETKREWLERNFGKDLPLEYCFLKLILIPEPDFERAVLLLITFSPLQRNIIKNKERSKERKYVDRNH